MSKLNQARESDQQPPKPQQRDVSPVQLRRHQGVGAPAARPVSLMDRMSKLNQAQNQWQRKVEDKDTKKFTVEGKMEREKCIKSIMSNGSSSAPPTTSTPTLPSTTPSIASTRTTQE